MSHRSTPERLDEARRAATRNRLIDEDRMPPDIADAWVSKWEAEAARRGLRPHTAAFWGDAREWVLGRREHRVRP